MFDFFSVFGELVFEDTVGFDLLESYLKDEVLVFAVGDGEAGNVQ